MRARGKGRGREPNGQREAGRARVVRREGAGGAAELRLVGVT